MIPEPVKLIISIKQHWSIHIDCGFLLDTSVITNERLRPAVEAFAKSKVRSEKLALAH